ncbi:epimerase [Sphingomonas sp. Leaf357]|uniref:NAD-dependent epimerase/dehydratase family protein n=1 Tax=Sphingomonas sp. Leaf357 TaxID=1736350 RepID=UPI0006F62E02|nr:NAD(P)-dependent oxidoreductase [Sphingomonas sp. Leaf357]KQS04408.1 epimerase [Sphingomonas sp. Leaf357]
MKTLAITGGTGFVGKRLIALARDHDYPVRALARRAQPARDGVTWIEGSLEDTDSLARLNDGADVAIHVAGVVNAPTLPDFLRGNAGGTANMIAAAEVTGVRRFVHVSSLSAREPKLSHYGHSKQLAEAEVRASRLDWTIVRPPAIYGPGDMELRDVFRIARMGLALLPPPGRMSVIHVDDLARLLIALVERDPGRLVLDPDDGVSGGWSHTDFARAVGAAVGRSVLPLPLPKALLSLAARADAAVRGTGAKLTQDRVGYMSHPDWTSDPKHRPDTALWQPEIATRAGLADTAKWYRANGLLG